MSCEEAVPRNTAHSSQLTASCVARAASVLNLLVLLLLAAPATAKDLDYRVVEPPGATATTGVVLALHGLGDSAVGFEALARRLRLPVRFVIPDAPDPHGGGFSWYRVGEPEAASDVVRSTDLLVRLIGAVHKRWPRSGKPLVLGYSQGAVMALSLAARHADRIAGAAALSGYLIPADLAIPKATKKSPPLFISHGRKDDVVPFAKGQAAADAFERAGWKVTFVTHELGHPLPPAILVRAEAWLAQCLPLPSAGPRAPGLSPK